MLRSLLKNALLKSRAGDYLCGQAQATWFERSCRQRREHYQQAVATDPAAHQPEAHLNP